MKTKGKKRKPLDPELKKFFTQYAVILKKLRNKAALTLEETEALGYPNWRHWQEIESSGGKKDITLGTLYKQAKVIGINFNIIL